MRAVFTVLVTVGCDARYIGRSRAETAECVRVREEREHPGRKPVTVECARDTIAKLSRDRVGKSVGSNDYITRYDVNPLSHLGMSKPI